MPDFPRHQCMIYEGAPSSHLAHIGQTLIQRLKAGYRCLYLNSSPMVAGMRWYLVSAGLDLTKETQCGALVLSSDREHLLGGKFDTERMITALGKEVRQALADGYTGLWAAGDMTWEFGIEDNFPKLLEYEQALEKFMHVNPSLCGVCLYHKNTLPAHAIEVALKVHPATYISSTLSQMNPLFL